MKPNPFLPTWKAASLLAVGAVVGVCLARPPAAGSRDGPDVEQRRQAALDGRQEDLLTRVAGRQVVLDAVIDGRVSLDEAAARFQQMDSRSATFNWHAFRRNWPGACDEERQRRAVIACVSGRLDDDPERARAVTRRLEAELQVFLSRSSVPCGQPRRGGRGQPTAPAVGGESDLTEGSPGGATEPGP